MGLMCNKIGREKLRPGDHIYTWRSGYSYSHHGIYVGDGKVIHLTREPGLIIFSSSSESSNIARVVCCNIEDFLCDGQLCRFEYGVSKILFVIKRAGTCSFASCNPPEDVLHRAFFLLEHGFGDYNLFEKNCEDFAFYCKTGVLKDNRSLTGGSAQIISLHAALSAVTLVDPYSSVPFIVLLPVIYGLFCFYRIDLAVPVEKLDNIWRPRREDMMTEKSTRWYLGVWSYLIYTIFAIIYWYWTPEGTILIRFKSCVVYAILCSFVSDHLRLLHGFELAEISAYTILLLAYFYWGCRSVGTILLMTRFSFIFNFLKSLIRYHPRRLKINENIYKIMCILVLQYWTPRITILEWIKLALLHFFYHILAANYVRNNPPLF